jgi:hypothetical protein
MFLPRNVSRLNKNQIALAGLSESIKGFYNKMDSAEVANISFH